MTILSKVEIDNAAQRDAVRILAERNNHTTANEVEPEIDLSFISLKEARKLMSAEHKALGYRPPPGSLAAQAQSAADKHASHSDDKATEEAARHSQQKVKRYRPHAGQCP